MVKTLRPQNYNEVLYVGHYFRKERKRLRNAVFRSPVDDLVLPCVARLDVQGPVVLGDVVGVERGAGRDGPRDGDARDVHAGRPVVRVEEPHERPDARLAEREAHVLGLRLRHAAGDQERPGAAPGHRGGDVGGGGEGADDVDGPRVQVGAGGQVAGRVRPDDRRVVDDGVRRPEFGGGLVEGPAQGVLVGDVGGAPDDGDPGGRVRGGRGADARTAARDERDGQALAGEARRHGPSDSRPRPDDHRSGHGPRPLVVRVTGER